jgi:hypothetical protein
MVEFEPEDVILAEDALETPEDLQRLLNSCYDVLGNLYDGRVQIMSELLSDNLAEPDNNNDYKAIYNRETNFFTSSTGGVYTDFYRACFRVNTLLESFDFIDGLSASERNRIEAEARFIRALCHWQVVMLWAQPYGYTSNNSHLGIVVREEAANTPLPRSNVEAAYELIFDDLEFARNNLPLDNGNYASKYSAYGLSAMVYMQTMNYSQAEQYASFVIQGPYQLDTLDRFSENVSTETVFGIVSFLIDQRNEPFRDNYRSDNNSNPQLALSDEFNSLMQLTPSDLRNDWINPVNGRYLSTKFNRDIFNIPVIHLSMLKLIRAEAIALNNGDLATAIQDVNEIRERAFGGDIFELPLDADANEVIAAAREEFRKETVCEGHWVAHLRRFGVMGEDITIRGAAWDCPGMALQFPNGESSIAGFVFNEEGGCN